jgi:signal peptidase II
MRNIVENVKKNWKKKTRYNLGIVWIIAAAVFSLDFFIKRYLAINFSFQSIPVIKNIFHITVVFNAGAAFGILKGKTSFLIYASLIFILIFLFFMRSENKKNLFFAVGCGLILGGAFSNLYDRIFIGFVIDYIDLRIWPVFNLSDTCICVGVGLLILDSFINTQPHRCHSRENSTVSFPPPLSRGQASRESRTSGNS